MKIAIIGAGGVGGYFGAKLAKAGNDVTFLARGAHGKAMAEQGLTVKSILGDFTVSNINVTDQITDLKGSDLILIAVKSWQVKELSRAIADILHPQSMVIPLQNGVMAIEELVENIDQQHLISGLCRIISQVEAPGVINHFGATPSIVIGELDHVESQRIQHVRSIVTQSGIELTISNNIQAEVWKKFIMICLSGLQAVTRTTLGQMRSQAETRAMMNDLLTEVYDLSQAIGISIESSYVDKTMAFLDTLPEATTFSLARDIWEKRPSEIAYQNGTVVKLGERHGVSTPINKYIMASLLPNELMARQ